MNIAIKLYPQTIWGEKYAGDFDVLLTEIAAAGIDTIIAPVVQGSRLIFPEKNSNADAQWNMLHLQSKCKEYNLAFIPEFPLFHDPDTFKNVEQYRPMNINGEYFTPTDWYHPICPSNTQYLQYRLGLLFQTIERFDPPIISLDFLQFPYLPGNAAFQAEQNILPEFCFCDFCKAKFQEFSGQMEPEKYPDYWFQFRQETITYIPVLIAEEIERQGRQVKLMAQIPAVTAPGSAENLQQVTGVNIEQWNNLVDIISPHIYTHQLSGENEWGHIFLSETQEITTAHIIPELDVPFYAVEPEENLQVGELIENLQESGFAALSLFHWELLCENDILLDFLAEQNN
ncbi:MAG: hypothetical protein DWQ05_19230 [Calditrichaeota bacterium]|nr:MAG: hypothetical protein DWQ05_19230 [Calditrichota bacterium]